MEKDGWDLKTIILWKYMIFNLDFQNKTEEGK